MSPFARLRVYHVFLKPGEAASLERLRFVAEGFSFYAFVFGAFWALYHQLWRLVALIVAFNATLGLATYLLELNPTTASIIQVGLQLWVGFHGNEFLCARFKRRGYILYALVSGENEIRAEQRFFDRYHTQLEA